MGTRRTIKKWIFIDGEQVEVDLPAIRVVCPECDGTGKVLMDGLRGAVFTPEEMDEDPDFKESYFSGDYDVTCDYCKGKNVVDEVDYDECTEEQRNGLGEMDDARAAAQAERDMERRMGC